MSNPPAGTFDTLDPGIHMGWAYFWGGILSECGLWDVAKPHPCAFRGRRTIIEWPVIYPKSPVPPNDILEVRTTAARAREKMGWDRCETVAPRKWKSNVAKSVMLVRIIEALSEDERRIYFKAADQVAEGLRNNIIDAIGIGLWKLDRLPR